MNSRTSSSYSSSAGGQLAAQQVDLGHRLEGHPAVFAAVQRQPVLGERLLVQALLPEGQSQVVVGQRPAFDDLRPFGGLAAGRCAVHGIAVEREIGLGTGEGRIELDGAPGRLAGVLVPAHVAIHEGQQVVRFGVVGVLLDGLAQRLERRLVQAPVVEHLAMVEAGHRAGGVRGARAREPIGGRIEMATRLFGQPELQHGGHIGGRPREQRLELGDRIGMAAERGVGPAKLPARVPVLGMAADPLLERGDAAVVVAAVAVGDVEVGLRHLHPRVQLQRADELGDRVLDQPLLIVEDAQVVVGAGVGGVDPAGKGAQDGKIALRQDGPGHRIRAGGWRRRWP